MSPVLTPTLLDPIAQTFELTETELGRLFGVSRQAVGQWRERGVPSNRITKVTTVAAIGDLLSHQLKPERIPGVARRPAGAYGGLSMLEMIERDREDELLDADPALLRLGSSVSTCARSGGAGHTCGWRTLEWDDPLDGSSPPTRRPLEPAGVVPGRLPDLVGPGRPRVRLPEARGTAVRAGGPAGPDRSWSAQECPRTATSTPSPPPGCAISASRRPTRSTAGAG